MFSSDTAQWAHLTFGQAVLGDARRTKRLVKVAAALASHSGDSLVQSMSSPAEVEAAYRFMRNESIEAQAIAEGGFRSTVEQAKNHDCLLALEDTTSLSFSHATVADEFGHINSHKNSRGIEVHSTLLYAPEAQEVVGLIEQHRWSRDITQYGLTQQRHSRAYKDKESYKWERNTLAITDRMAQQMSKVIAVCDREADIFDYLQHKLSQQQRFVVRSKQSRRIQEGDGKLYSFGDSLGSAGTRHVDVMQKGGRKARKAVCEVRFAPATLKVPTNKKGQPIPLYYVSCLETNNTKGLCWHLLTSEPVNNVSDAHRVINYYEKRWLIEEFHKAWKSGGTQVEDLRMQSKANLERMLVILALVAVRLLQLRSIGVDKALAEQHSCEEVLSTKAWKLLWKTNEKKTPFPEDAPTLHWAYLNLAKLGGWYDSKRNGRVGYERIWDGWLKLQILVEGYEMALSLKHDL